MLKILSITVGLEFLLSLSASDALAIQNIIIYEGDIQSDDIILNSSLNLELFLLALSITIGFFLYKKVTQKHLNSQLPVQQLQNRVEVLETIIVNSDD
jgi:hypothetical protein